MIHRILKIKDSQAEEIWLTVYGDLITNLLLLFLALYGLTVMGNEAVVEAIRSMSKRTANVSLVSNSPEGSDMGAIARALQERLLFTPGVRVSNDVGAVRIEFGEQVLFESGAASPKPSSFETIRGVADILRILPYTIVVEGHTDNVAIKAGGKFKNNWELSMARAMSVVRLLQSQGEIPSAQMAAAAYGAYRPKASNLTKNDRRLNRRVEIALFKDFGIHSGSEK